MPESAIFKEGRLIEEHECESGSIKSLFNFSAGKSNALASSNYRAFPANIHKPAQQCANNRLQATRKSAAPFRYAPRRVTFAVA